MNETRIDRRAARTRKLLHASLAGLLARKPYEAITVEEICTEAEVGRSTFYAHFVDKDDLQRHALDRLGAELASDGDGEEPFAFCEAFFAHAAAHLPQVCAKAGGRRETASLAQVRRMVTAQVQAELYPPGSSAEPSVRSARVAFVVGALMGLFDWWLEGGAKRPAHEMAALFRQLTVRGVHQA